MSDYNNPLPIRTENPGDAIVKIADANVPSQQLKVEPDGSINVKPTAFGNLLEGIIFDYIEATYPLTTQEVYTYKTGGSGGSIVATITVNYTDSSKSLILNVGKV